MSSRSYRARTMPRVAPRRRSRGRPASRINWDRLGRVVLVIVLAGVLFSYLNPVVNLIHSLNARSAGKEQLVDLQRQNTELKQNLTALKDPGVLEREARKVGMVKPGEQSYVIRGLPH